MQSSSNLHINRPTIASGRFYSAHSQKLESEIANMISSARKLSNYEVSKDTILALISPHAGYIFSGIIAASAFMQLENLKPRKRIFLIGSSHHTDFNGASIYNIGDYLTPFGKVKVDLELANQLIEKSELINFVPEAHAYEHSLEVMLPFIQYFWKNNFEIIPIVIATHSKDICKKLSEELQPYLNKENLFVISTDLSHYPNYSNALEVDKKTVQAVLTGVPEVFLEQIQTNKQDYIPHLDTSMCGWTSVLTLMYMSEKLENTSFEPILYQNSGDIEPFGDKDRVIGYQSMVLLQKQIPKAFNLSDEEKQILIDTVFKSIKSYPTNEERYTPKLDKQSENLLSPTGAFVSIYLDKKLRGCIGRMHSEKTALIEIVNDLAISAAFHDNRFPDLSYDELERVSIEISVLSPMQRINDISEIKLGKHGIYIKKGPHTGTFLPQVADKSGWSVEEFVSNCSKNKAGLGPLGWKNAELFIYEAIVFKSS